MIQMVQTILGESCYMVSDGNADVDLAKKGIQLKCPVLSDDSDFYVFPLPNGYIPYTKFDWRNAKEVSSIRVAIYYYFNFQQQFGISEGLLCLIPAIAGNDTGISHLKKYKQESLSKGKPGVITLRTTKSYPRLHYRLYIYIYIYIYIYTGLH